MADKLWPWPVQAAISPAADRLGGYGRSKRPRIACEENTMAVPRKKVSRMKRGTRRSADALVAPIYVEDKDSGERRRPHHIDLTSGKYRGRQILAPKADV